MCISAIQKERVQEREQFRIMFERERVERYKMEMALQEALVNNGGGEGSPRNAAPAAISPGQTATIEDHEARAKQLREKLAATEPKFAASKQKVAASEQRASNSQAREMPLEVKENQETPIEQHVSSSCKDLSTASDKKVASLGPLHTAKPPPASVSRPSTGRNKGASGSVHSKKDSAGAAAKKENGILFVTFPASSSNCLPNQLHSYRMTAFLYCSTTYGCGC